MACRLVVAARICFTLIWRLYRGPQGGKGLICSHIGVQTRPLPTTRRETVRAFYNFLNLHTCLNLNTCRCHATSGLAHMFDATQHHGLGWGGGWGGGGDDDVLWACTHVGCYGTADVL